MTTDLHNRRIQGKVLYGCRAVKTLKYYDWKTFYFKNFPFSNGKLVNFGVKLKKKVKKSSTVGAQMTVRLSDVDKQTFFLASVEDLSMFFIAQNWKHKVTISYVNLPVSKHRTNTGRRFGYKHNLLH